MLGDDDTNALMTEFPSVEADELVTKDFLRAELAELQNRLTVRMSGMIAVSTAILGLLVSIG